MVVVGGAEDAGWEIDVAPWWTAVDSVVVVAARARVMRWGL